MKQSFSFKPKILSRLVARFILPLLGIICGLQNNMLKNNYSDLRLDPFYSRLYLGMSLLMAVYYGLVAWYLIRNRKMSQGYYVLIIISFLLFVVGVAFPYTPQGNDILSLRHVDFVFLSMSIYIGVLIRYISLDYRIFYFQKKFLLVLILGAILIFSFSLMINSLLETWGMIGVSNLLNRLYEREKGFDI